MSQTRLVGLLKVLEFPRYPIFVERIRMYLRAQSIAYGGAQQLWQPELFVFRVYFAPLVKQVLV